MCFVSFNDLLTCPFFDWLGGKGLTPANRTLTDTPQHSTPRPPRRMARSRRLLPPTAATLSTETSTATPALSLARQQSFPIPTPARSLPRLSRPRTGVRVTEAATTVWCERNTQALAEFRLNDASRRPASRTESPCFASLSPRFPCTFLSFSTFAVFLTCLFLSRFSGWLLLLCFSV